MSSFCHSMYIIMQVVVSFVIERIVNALVKLTPMQQSMQC